MLKSELNFAFNNRITLIVLLLLLLSYVPTYFPG